jgi:hypothetical protein
LNETPVVPDPGPKDGSISTVLDTLAARIVLLPLPDKKSAVAATKGSEAISPTVLEFADIFVAQRPGVDSLSIRAAVSEFAFVDLSAGHVFAEAVVLERHGRAGWQ